MAFGSFAGGATFFVGADTSDFNNKLSEAKRTGTTFVRDLGALGSKLLTAGASLGTGLGLASREFAQVDDALRTTKGILGLTEDQFVTLEATVRSLGATTSFTTRQIAAATTELARGGQSIEQITSSLPAVLALSRATNVELAETGSIVVRTLGQFQLAADQSGRVADSLASGANAGAFGLVDLGESLKFVGPIARELNIGLEETVASLAVLANNGLRGGEAGTQLARALKELSNSAKQAKLEDLFDIKVVDKATGNLRGLTAIVDELGPKLRELGSAERVSALEDVFGRGGVTFSNLASNVDQLKEINLELLLAEGNAAALARQIDEGPGGAFRLLLSGVQDFGITVGDAIKGQVIQLLQLLRSGVTTASAWVKENQELVQTLARVAVGITLVGGSLVTLSTGLFALGALAAALVPLAAIFAGPAGLAVGIGLVLPLVAALGYNLKTYIGASLDEISASQGRVLRETDKLLLRLTKLSEAETLSDDDLRSAVAIVETLEDRFGSLGVSINNTTGEILGLVEAMDRVALNGAIGNIEQSIADTEAKIEKQGERLAKFREQQGLPDARNAVIEKEQNRLASQLQFYQDELTDRRSELAALGKAGASDLRRDNGTVKSSGISDEDLELTRALRDTLRQSDNGVRRSEDSFAQEVRAGLEAIDTQSKDQIRRVASALEASVQSAGLKQRDGSFGGRGLSQRFAAKLSDLQPQMLATQQRTERLLEKAVQVLESDPGLLAS